jgi:heme oxygenase
MPPPAMSTVILFPLDIACGHGMAARRWATAAASRRPPSAGNQLQPLAFSKAKPWLTATFSITGTFFMPAVAAFSNSPAPHGHRAGPPELRNLLKQATAEAHRDLDTRLSALDLSSVDGYRRFLEANAAALLPLERALEAAGVASIFADWPERTRAVAITADLAKVGGTARPTAARPAMNRNIVFGTMYVLEGSRLGAKYLLRTIAQDAAPVAAGATAYLSHGAGRQLWPSFLATLENEPATADDEAEIIDGAVDAFAVFAQAVRA